MKKGKSYIQDTNDFFKKKANLPPLPGDLILCTIEVVGFYPNISHEEGLIAIRKTLDNGKDKTDSLIELAEYVLKNNIVQHNKSVFKLLRGITIGTKIAPPYAIMFMDSLKEYILSNSLLRALVW